MIFSWAWYISTMPGLTRWLTTARAAIAPLMLNSSTQSLSTMPAVFASSSDSQITGPPRLSVSMIRLSLYVEWMPHFWCGVMKFSWISVLPLGLMPAMPAVVFRSTGGR